MNCNDCKDALYQIEENTEAFREHLSYCGSCDAEYEEIQTLLSALQPKTALTAPLSVKTNVLRQIEMEEAKERQAAVRPIKSSFSLKRLLAVASLVGIILFVFPFVGKNKDSQNTTKAAESLFTSAIYAVDSVRNMAISFSARTGAHDNFDNIDKDGAMIHHLILKRFERPEKWRIEKSERVVLFDGRNQYLWIPATQMAVKGPAGDGFVGWLRLLLDPATIFWKENADAKENAAGISMKKSGELLFVSILSRQKDNYLYNYLKDKSMDEADSRREYVFDDHTKLLKGLKIYLLYHRQETLVFETDHIGYNTTLSDTAFNIPLPAGIEWKVLSTPGPSPALSHIDSKAAAEMAFEDLSEGAFENHKELWSQFHFFSKGIFRKVYQGLQVIKIGEPFKSGKFPGEFVPYTIRLSDGKTKTWTISLRNDNPNKVWVIDGGI